MSKKANATVGGSAMPAMDYSRRERGDGRGRALCPSSEKVKMTRKANAIPGGGMLPLEPLKGEHSAPKTPEPVLYGMGLLGPIVPKSRGPLSKRFLIPPFSVLDARAGYWQDRKRAWLSLGIQSELGRGQSQDTYNDREWVKEKGLVELGQDTHIKPSATAVSQKLAPGGGGGGCWLGGPKTGSTDNFNKNGKKADAATFGSGGPGDLVRKFKGGLATGLHNLREAQKNGEPAPDYHGQEQSGTSIFDPVLCECIYRWFSPVGGQILDPFAGGSVRGVVAGLLGRNYLGVDLRAEQCEANRKQRKAIGVTPRPKWKVGDSGSVVPALDIEADLCFSCPPYADLERYSDDPRDLSTMKYEDFLEIYRTIIRVSIAKLKPNRFACFVVGDIRDMSRGGIYRNFPGDTIAAFQDAGAMLYNEIILVTAVGSLPIRTGRQFAGGRKVGKTHQNVLVFVKGDPKEASLACGEL